ncbi:hypothetical protein PP749_gp093 [Rhizobium phage RHEph22]|uniref:Uncharacterized protein n=1 Tax=Rhizobium phage RHEph22 TaxID=2836135 RepID=A0AAE7VN07_9CAUD|nr:hypothetical protein PP749_gp093 [Rhizobium phage RHEph22]QXV74772.1 hypothetical protein [Rhizobium phage RHEph22]QXV74868.1 hypothetical protein [Rhizobium phage RHEph24]
MKEPSELDLTLIRDLKTKLYLGEGGSVRATSLTQEQLNTRRAALGRILHHYELMSNEISRLVLEKNNLD